jgi:hypothetical protein
MFLAVNSSWHNHHQEKKTKTIVYMPIDSMENKRQAQKKDATTLTRRLMMIMMVMRLSYLDTYIQKVLVCVTPFSE